MSFFCQNDILMSRILHIGKYFPPFAGGIENFLADIMPIQTSQGEVVAAIVHNHRFSLKMKVQPEIWQQQTIYRVPSYGRLLYAPVSPQFPFWLNRVLHEFQPELLHLHLPNTSAFWALWQSEARYIPWVIHWHADVFSVLNKKLAIAYKAYRPFEQQLLAHAKNIIVTSPPYLTASTALDKWQHKCQVIPLGVNLEHMPTIETTNQWNSKGVRFLSVGRLSYYKGHEFLIRAMANIENAQLIIVGKGEQYSYLNKLITQLNLNDNVKLLGYCSDTELNALFASCDCFCLASLERTEAFGVVFLEAMRHNKPIIATDIPGSGVGWVVKDGGLLVKPQDVTALARALKQMINQPLLAANLAKRGQQRLNQLFDINNVSAKISDLYQQVLNYG